LLKAEDNSPVGAHGDIAVKQRNAAERNARMATSRQLAAQAELIKTQQASSLPHSVLLAAEASERFPSHPWDELSLKYIKRVTPGPRLRLTA